ncbi:MAG: hypothetical protein LBF22_12295 [Deltaproteobacteria bacterium]|jgi:hypothetical protein|nr:hypothetical protein [Deltaproteobacteria bacterium]
MGWSNIPEISKEMLKGGYPEGRKLWTNVKNNMLTNRRATERARLVVLDGAGESLPSRRF